MRAAHMLTTRPVEFWAREFCWESRNGAEFSIWRWISLLCQECCAGRPRRCKENVVKSFHSDVREREREKRLGHIAKKETKGGKQLAIFHTGYTFTIDYSRRTVGSSWVGFVRFSTTATANPSLSTLVLKLTSSAPIDQPPIPQSHVRVVFSEQQWPGQLGEALSLIRTDDVSNGKYYAKVLDFPLLFFAFPRWKGCDDTHPGQSLILPQYIYIVEKMNFLFNWNVNFNFGDERLLNCY